MPTSGVLAYRATYALFVLALPLYIWYRWTYTVAWDADSRALRLYQAAVALVELFGGVSVLLLGAVRFPRPWAFANPRPSQPEVDASDPESIRGFQVSILIPCYSEPDEIILGAVRAALGLRHPLASRVTVYLLDDGGRPERAAAVRALGAQYVSRPKDPSKPRHGKAGNLNYFFRGVLCGGARPLCEGGVPGPEHVVAVFDCDMEAHADFLGHTLPYLAAEPRVALVQTPQAFFNVAPAADIFNHNNVGFFQAVQPGLDAWGASVCCGTNFAVRAAALHEVGWFPPVVRQPVRLRVRLLPALGDALGVHLRRGALEEHPVCGGGGGWRARAPTDVRRAAAVEAGDDAHLDGRRQGKS